PREGRALRLERALGAALAAARLAVAAAVGVTVGADVLAGRRFERLGLGGLLPEEVGILPAEVTLGRGRLVDGPPEVQLADERAPAAIEVGAYDLGQAILVDLS